MPELVRLYIRQCLIGFAIAVVFVALLLGLNVANLRHLVFNVPGGWLAGVLLVVFNGVVFAGVQFGIAIMGMAEPRRGGGGGATQAVIDFVTLPVPVEAKRRDRSNREDVNFPRA